ncbi:crossover junction endonuclease MUS81, partial [Lecanoromycetidae sp. Uapishka_2]
MPPSTHPSEAQQLDGIGEKICKRLTEKLIEHCEANGLPAPKKSRGKARKLLTAEDLPDGEEAPAAKKPRKAKPYVPSLRTGPYALILALSSIPEDSLQSLTKAEVIDLAQPHCESSFTVPSEAGKFYTAWNSMTTLVNKDLVQEKGRPLRKYMLTEEGWDVAKRIKAVQEGDVVGNPAEKKKSSGAKVQGIGDGSTGHPSNGNDVFINLEDESDQDDLYRMQPKLCIESESLHRAAKTGSISSGQRLGGAPVDKFGTFSESRKPTTIPYKDTIEFPSSPEPEAPPAIPWRSSKFGQDSRSNTSRSSNRPVQEAFKPSVRDTSLSRDPRLPLPSTNQVAEAPAADTCLPTFEPVVLQPGTFTVELVLDNREVRAKNDRDYISDELTKKGVKPLVRPLELGDIFWVAKLKDPSLLARYGEEGDEIALDWIVERKRLDDLVGSITDGRFQEQKFRLRRSGVKNVIYLIEEFSLSTEKLTKFHEAIQSAIASTQVVNGYFVKRTQKLDETIRYLARMTRMLKTLYEPKSLHLIPTSALTPSSYLPLLTHLRTDPAHAARSYSITYPSFSSLASKSDSLTLRDVFLKMLMCTRGISGDKALAIQKIWSTPRAFIEAFEGCKIQKERDLLLETKLGALAGRGKIKGVLGAKVAGIWGEE